MDQQNSKSRKACPKDTARFFSVLTFFYTLKIFIKGFKRELEADDVYAVMKKLKSKDLGTRLEKEWHKRSKISQKLTLLRVMWFCFGWRFMAYGAFDLTTSTYLNLAMPRSTGRIVTYFSEGEEVVSVREVYCYVALYLFSILIDIFLYNNYALLMVELAASVRAAFCSMLYRKSLRLSPSVQSEYTTGKLVSLMTKDVQVMDTFAVNGCNAWIAIVQIFIITTLLYVKIGFAAIVGVGSFLLALPLEIYISQKIGSLRKESSKRTDIRLQYTQEALSAIKIMKMYAWEKFFISKAGEARKEEIYKLRRLNYMRALIVCISSLASHVSFYILLITFIKYGTEVTPENIFYSITIYRDLRFFVGKALPFGIVYLAEMKMSATRIENLMDAEELPPKMYQQPDPTGKIIIKNVSSKIRDNVLLKNVTCTINRGLSIITGPLGSGKSSLLKLILQEYPVTEGNLKVHGSVSYASQDPWIFPATIKQNILFGEPLDEVRYQKVVEVCALNYDFDLLANGDRTIAEDRGMNLSKGQQARINLARAIYRKCDIYLLDDCLASLDTRVQAYIFRECVVNFLRHKTCVLVTHNTKSFKDADQILLIENGYIKCTDEIRNSKEIPDCNYTDTNIYPENGIDDTIEKIEENCTELSQLLKPQKFDMPSVYQEIKKTGSVDFDVYKRFSKFGGGILVILFVFSLYLCDQFTVSYLEKIISSWVNTLSDITKFVAKNDTNSTEYWIAVEESKSFLNHYLITLVVTHFAVIIKTTFFIYYISCISIKIHKEAIKKVINASMTFFDNTFVGNILNRFSRDISIIDEELPLVLSECIRAACEVIGIFGLVATVNLIYIFMALLVLILLVGMRHIYIRTGRSLKRLDSATRSPMIGHLHATIEGLTTIRACGKQDTVREEFDRHQDLYTSAFHMSCMTQKGFAVSLHMLSFFYISFMLLHLILYSDVLAGDAGLVLTQASSLTALLQQNMFQWALLENQMTSVERVLEYTTINQEPNTGLRLDHWPINGSIIYNDVSLTYKKTNEKVLKNVNLSIAPKAKIGIAGRTGAGKSSIISTLFRLYDIGGSIVIDNVDTSKLALDFLRSSISIIPQDPILFKGSIRENVDSFGLQTDEKIWEVLSAINIRDKIQDLDSSIADMDTQFSAGQRQLICLARALLKKNKIIILDEATANMDPETNALIESIIANQFKDCTVLTVAHKLDTIMNSDRVIVIDKGEVVEFDRPTVLAQKKDSLFYSMLEE